MLLDKTYVVFDLETTGLNADKGDSIIEIGAVKLKEGRIIDSYDTFVNPNVKLSKEIISITGINDKMLVDAPNEEDAVKDFINWASDYPLVAHNARFDISFINSAYRKYNLGKINNTLIDTLGLSRYLESNERYHNLATLVIRYNIPWDENNHHRADYDAHGTALIFNKMLMKLMLNNIKTIKDLKKYKNIVLKYNNMEDKNEQ